MVFLAAAGALATPPAHFGSGARSAALARADVADADATSAPVQNAALAAAPGIRLRIGYGHGAMDLRIDGRRAPIAPASGLDLAAQAGWKLSSSFSAGLALGAHLPDAHIAAIAFRPGTEPQFFRYEAPLQRASFDLVAALRYRAFALGAGASFALDMGGEGTRFDLGGDAQGTYPDAATDIALEYRAAPIVGLSLDLGRVALGASFRGPLAVGVSVSSDVTIALAENPLNGTTAVRVTGASGYDPARLLFGGRVKVAGGLSISGALEWQGYRAAPPPVADVTLDVRLGTSPGRKEVRFVLPRFRDVLAPRLGIEWVGSRGAPGAERAAGDRAIRWAARAGYVLAPSPVPPQTGFTSYADATRHGMSIGGGLGLGRFWGVDLRLDATGALSLLAPRTERKKIDALPFAQYEVSGRTWYGALSFEGGFK
ncbi:hypothetical protein [Polyangium aurulentum]|uniref:hypothetical protein n=1 Tax=Polyangium aurulentum TaxID=2567896 RepID=UPI0010ADFC00|nr:hypothetical protein [Polyangium aurulentum]UQA63375.1 hypothetical protein E8A73_024065 [Polyangium aurulentum]